MTLILSGTDGLSDVDGSAATPAIRGTDANTGIFFPAADTVGVSTGGSERMRIDSSGNVGIGTSSPATQLHVSGTNAVLNITRSTKNFYLNPNYANGGSYATFESDLALATVVNGAERMRIDSSGNLLFNSGYGSVATAYGCRAWCYYNNSQAIVGSANISSITSNGTGDVVLNFTTAMPDANYSAVASTNEDGGTAKFCNVTQPATSNIRVVTYNLAGTKVNNTYNFVAVFR